MPLRFEEITDDNYHELIDLEVKPDQKNCFYFKSTKPNIMSLAEAYVRKGSKVLAVYNDDTMIGCVYYHIFKLPEGKKEAWITRFMIDQRYQGKGLGRETMNMLIAHIREEAGEDVSIGLSYEPENALAKKLYDSLGFVASGKIFGGQVVVWLEV